MADAEVVFRTKVSLGGTVPGTVDPSWVENRVVGSAELIVVRVLDSDPATVTTTLPSISGIICCEHGISPVSPPEYVGGQILLSTDHVGQLITITNAHDVVQDQTRQSGTPGAGLWDRYCSLLVIA